MNIEYENNEWIAKVKGAEVIIEADLKLEVDFDARDLVAFVDRIYINISKTHSTPDQRRINASLCDWERIDDIPDYQMITDAVHNWSNTEDAISSLYEVAEKMVA